MILHNGTKLLPLAPAPEGGRREGLHIASAMNLIDDVLPWLVLLLGLLLPWLAITLLS
jgi:hypothetical protein